MFYLIATVGRVGNLPWMPGTFGSLAGLLFLFTLNWFGATSVSLAILTVLMSVIGWYATQSVLKEQNFSDSDPSYIVIDEVAGMFTAAMVFSFYHPITPIHLILIFILFRFFDILKPWPIGWIDRRLAEQPSTASLGVMLDDIAAGIATAIVLLLFSFVFSGSCPFCGM
ncbi:MAG: phosphatidylglycerophosphatase A [Alphaproteobacteria bacterium]|nr:phosphatidylglycerophosphatase A [Alphaproteobacteria bacterium]